MRRLGSILLLSTLMLASGLAVGENAMKEKVSGIGGLFFRAEDPAALAEWYEEHLGVSRVPTSYEEPAWSQEAGPTVFAPFSKNTDYFGNAEKAWMINFRVKDLDAMAAQLREAGVEVTIDPEESPTGRFARPCCRCDCTTGLRRIGGCGATIWNPRVLLFDGRNPRRRFPARGT